MPKKYIVELDAQERANLQAIVRKGKAAAKKILHAQIILKADSGEHGPGWKDREIVDVFSVDVSTVERIRKRLVENGIPDALNRRPRSLDSRKRKLDGEGEAHLFTLACSEAPPGRVRWTIRLLADKLVELEIVDSIGRETVRATLKKM